MSTRQSWVELRVHGVSGTPPQDMLGCRDVVQVAGDEASSFYRPADSCGQELTDGDHILEAYHWGKFTSGSWRQGLWLALLPFGAVNAAQFMLPRPGPPPSPELFADPDREAGPGERAAVRWHAVAGGMLRLIGLALTCMLLLSAAIVAVDLTAWQSFPTRGGSTQADQPGWQLAAALVVCAILLLLLASFGRDNQRGPPPAAPEGHKGAPDVPPTDLGRASFFRGDPDAPALRRLHVAAGFALLAGLGFEIGAPVWARAVGWGWLLVLVVVTVFLGDPERGARGAARGRWKSARAWWHETAVPRATRWGLVPSGVLLLAAALTTAARRHTRVESARAAPGIDGAAFGVLLVCVLGLTGLGLSCLLLARATRTSGAAAPPPAFQRFTGGLTTFLITAIGVFLGVGYAAAFCYGWASLLNRGEGPRVEVPPLLQRVAFAWGVTAVLVLLIALGTGGLARCRRQEFCNRAEAAFTFGLQKGPRLPRRWLPKVAAAMVRARLKNLLEWFVWVFAGVGIVLSVAAGWEYWLSRHPTTRCATAELWGPLRWLSEPQKCDSSNLVIWLGTATLIGLAAGLVLLGRGAVRRQSLRRGVNVVWDVIAFWPRAVHPFVPPPYSQLAVADLRRRIRWHLGTTTGLANPRPAEHVVVAAHSQGSLIALSALLWLTAEERGRVGLVTFGSQLQVQFPRAFPAYVDVDVLRWTMQAYGGRWVNLYRDTDAIAGPVLSWDHAADGLSPTLTSRRLPDGSVRVDEVTGQTGRRICGPDWRLLDPTPSDPGLQTGPVAVVRGHSDYPADPDYPLALAAVRPASPGRPPRPRRTFDHGLSPPFAGGRPER